MDNVLILTEAGGDIGFGHIVRCKALSKKIDNSVVLLNYKGSYNDSDDNIILLNWSNKENLINFISNNNYDIVIIDSYLAKEDFYPFLKQSFKKVIVIDDYNRIKYKSVDLVINPGIFGDVIDYSNQTARCIGGKDYIIIREEFTEYRNTFYVKDKAGTIGISMGGSDYRELLPILCNMFATSDNFKNIILFCGNNNYKEKLYKQFGHIKKFVFWGLLDANEMAENMLKADIIISAAGQTLNELAFLGIPTITVCIDNDQEFNMQGYYNYGFIKQKIYWNDKNFDKKIINAIELVLNMNERQSISLTGKNIVDGKGKKRIINDIKNINCNCRLRIVNTDDVEILFKWANDKDVRENAVNPEPIDFKSHKKWFLLKLKNKNTHIFVLEKKNIPLGQIRFDKVDDYYEIDYSIDKDYRGTGLGNIIIDYGIKELKKITKDIIKLKAIVKKGNIKSEKIFLKFDFKYLKTIKQEFKVFVYEPEK